MTPDIDNIPNPDASNRIFDSETINIYKNEGFTISLHKPDMDAPLRMAMVSKNFDRVTVYCSKYTQVPLSDGGGFLNPLYYPLDQILLMLFLAHNRGGLLHAGGLYMGNRAFLFPGKSGAGKSTLCRQLEKNNDFRLMNDDRFMLRNHHDCFKAYGTPWPGENRYTVNIGLPVGGIFFINKSSENRILPMGQQEAFEKLMPVLSIPWYEPDLVSNYLTFCESLVNQVPAYELSFKPDTTISNVFKEFIKTI
jgi:hypothetical protein